MVGSALSVAREYGLEPIFHADFQQIFVQEKDDPHFADLLRRMRVVDDQGNTDMTFDQWEAASQFTPPLSALSCWVWAAWWREGGDGVAERLAMLADLYIGFAMVKTAEP